MLPIIGRDKNGGAWYKSDQYITDISKAAEFYVKHRWFGLGAYSVIAVTHCYRKDKEYPYAEHFWTERREIGRFRTALEASFGLEEAMRLKDITPLPSQ